MLHVGNHAVHAGRVRVCSCLSLKHLLTLVRCFDIDMCFDLCVHVCVMFLSLTIYVDDR